MVFCERSISPLKEPKAEDGHCRQGHRTQRESAGDIGSSGSEVTRNSAYPTDLASNYLISVNPKRWLSYICLR